MGEATRTAARPGAASIRAVWLLTGVALSLLLFGTAPPPAHRTDELRAQPAAPAALLPVQSRKVENLGPGKLLVASRNLGDPNFAETVVLLLHYDAAGVVGLILNRRSRVPLSRVLEEPKAAKDRSDPVYLGGPVDTATVFALLQSPAKVQGAEHVFGEVYLISSKSLFEQTMSAAPNPGVFHVYLGYAGWGKEQLQREVELGAWFIFQPDAGTVFNPDPDSLWSQMIRKTELKIADNAPANADLRPLLWSSARSSAPLADSEHTALQTKDN